jgi:MFS family permease
MRWTILIIISTLLFATYWFQDFYSGLKGLLETQLGFTSEEYGRMIGFTTIVNLFGMIILGGMVLDKWGVKIAGTIFGVIAVAGGLLSALGSYGVFGDSHAAKLTMMIIGRVLFGSGFEVMCVIVTRTVVKWFKGYELALAMSINMGIGRLGSAMGIALSIDIGRGSVTPAIAFAATLIGIAFISFLVYLIFDRKLDKERGRKTLDEADNEEFKIADIKKLVTNRSFVFITLLCVAFYSAVFPFIQYAPDLLVNKFGFSYQLPAMGDYFELFGSRSVGNATIFLGLFGFGVSFSMVPQRISELKGKIAAITGLAVVFVLFIYILRGTLSIWLTNGPKTASLIPMGTILFTPIFGSYVDKNGRAASLMILGSILLIMAHLFLSVFNNIYLGYLGLLILGIAFSLIPAAMWPSVAKIVPESRLGTAYATMFTVQNWGLMTFFWGIGAVLDLVNRRDLDSIRSGEMNYDYTIPILMLVFLGVVSAFLALKQKDADRKQGLGLVFPS